MLLVPLGTTYQGNSKSENINEKDTGCTLYETVTSMQLLEGVIELMVLKVPGTTTYNVILANFLYLISVPEK